ncbi:MAG TPA: GTPase, partial [Candidatus Gracilibacteria bacterium]
MIPTVAIIGRPNVGKSTLFNALLGQRRSIVSDISGTTRDNVMSHVDPHDQFGSSDDMVPYYLVDTAGLTNAKGETLEKAVVDQALMSIDQADLILFVLDS